MCCNWHACIYARYQSCRIISIHCSISAASSFSSVTISGSITSDSSLRRFGGLYSRATIRLHVRQYPCLPDLSCRLMLKSLISLVNLQWAHRLVGMFSRNWPSINFSSKSVNDDTLR